MSQTRAGGFVVASVAVSEGAVAAPDAPLLLEPEQRQALQAFLEPRAPGIDAGTTSLRESLSFLNEWLAGAPDYDPAFPNADLTYVAQTMATAGERLFVVYCTPCHGASGKGDGLVATKFVPPADLTSADLQKARTDGYWQSYLSVGGAIMPSYAEALSPVERWHVVNYLRTLAQK